MVHKDVVINEDEEQWLERRDKRRAALKQLQSLCGPRSWGPQPPAPNPDDRTLSKRGWEGKFFKYKYVLGFLGVLPTY